MPRMSREETAQTRAWIIETAAGLFREQGIGATGVADIMSAAGLTHGGFYRHFASKEALAAEAISYATCRSLEELEKTGNSEACQQALVDFVDRYLSNDHVDHPGKGCPLVALGSEARYAPAKAAEQLAEASDRAITALATAMDAEREQASALMATLVGTVTLARMARTGQQRDQILAAGKSAAAKYMTAAPKSDIHVAN